MALGPTDFNERETTHFGWLRHAAALFSLSSEHFMAIYLLAHGLIKIVMVAALLRNRLWAYPAAIFVFTGFIAYQLYRYTFTGGIGLILLSAFALFLIGIIWLEYRAQRRHRTPIF